MGKYDATLKEKWSFFDTKVLLLSVFIEMNLCIRRDSGELFIGFFLLGHQECSIRSSAFSGSHNIKWVRFLWQKRK